MEMFTFECPNCAEIKVEVFSHSIIDIYYVHATPRETGGNDGVTQQVISVHLEGLGQLQTNLW